MDWLPGKEPSGDALRDIPTQYGRLSVYRVASKAEGRRVAVALAATRKHVSNLDYIVFDGSDLDSLGIKVEVSAGDTPDETVNELHHDLENLTVKRLARLAEIISAGERHRIQRKAMGKLLNEAASTGRLDIDKVNSGIQERLRR